MNKEKNSNSVHLLQRKEKSTVGWEIRFLERERERAHSLYICGHSDRRFSTEQEDKLIHAARAKRGHRFGGVLTTPRGRNLFLLGLFFG